MRGNLNTFFMNNYPYTLNVSVRFFYYKYIKYIKHENILFINSFAFLIQSFKITMYRKMYNCNKVTEYNV